MSLLKCPADIRSIKELVLLKHTIIPYTLRFSLAMVISDDITRNSIGDGLPYTPQLLSPILFMKWVAISRRSYFHDRDSKYVHAYWNIRRWQTSRIEHSSKATIRRRRSTMLYGGLLYESNREVVGDAHTCYNYPPDFGRSVYGGL